VKPQPFRRYRHKDSLEPEKGRKILRSFLDAEKSRNQRKKENKMSTKKTSSFRTQALSVLTVRHGREVAEALRASAIRKLLHGEYKYIQAAVMRLESGEVTDERVLHPLETVREKIGQLLPAEVIGSKAEFIHAGYDSEGDIWAVATVPDYSGRGTELQAIVSKIERFLEVRQKLIDEALGERLYSSLLR
jgi:hypothetical protein